MALYNNLISAAPNRTVAGILVAGTVLSLVGFAGMRQIEDRRLRDDFALQSERRIRAISRQLDGDLFALSAVRGFMESRFAITAADFDAFSARILESHPSLLAVEWIARVPADGLPSFEAALRQDGVRNAEITAGRPGTGKLAGKRTEYDPVRFLFPRNDENRSALGYDFGSCVPCKRALDRASSSGQPATMARLRILERGRDGFGVPVVLAAYPGGNAADTPPAGYAMVILQVASVVESALRPFASAGIDRGINIDFYDEAAVVASPFLYSHRPGGARSSPALSYAQSLPVGSRSWKIVCAPTDAYLAGAASFRPWMVLFSGLFVTLVFAGQYRSRAAISNLRESEAGARQMSERLEALVGERTAKLRESEGRLWDALNGVSDGFWEWTIGTGEVYYSPQWIRLLGYEPGDVPARVEFFFDILHPDDVEPSRLAIEDHLAGRKPLKEGEVRLRMKSGRYLPVYDRGRVVARDQSGKPLRMAGSISDISERLEAQQALRDERDRLRQIIDAHFALVAVLSPSGTIREINRAPLALMGIEREQAIGRDFVEIGWLPDPASQSAVRDGIVRAAAGEAVSVDVVSEFPQVGRRNMDGVLSPLRDPNRTVVGVVAFGVDSTRRKRLEDELRQAQKMEAVGRLAGGVAHDFNNLLMVINGYADLLLGQVVPGGAAWNQITEIARAGERAADLTRQLLIFSRKQVTQTRVLNLNSAIAGMRNMLQRLIGEDIALETDLDPALANVLADPGQMSQVLMNLAANARDAMPNGGRLNIRTMNVPGEERVRLTVTDSGLGMDEETRAHLFEPFFTTKRMGAGTGLGLATVYGAVRQAGGAIEVVSAPGEGTAIDIVFPRCAEAAVSEALSNAPAAALAGSETILVVEDQEELRALACLVLKNHGYRVVDAADGPAALREAGRFEGPIHLLLTDVMMPGMNGQELADSLRRVRPLMKVIYISGHTVNAVVQDQVADGSTGYLQKPVSAGDIMPSVKTSFRLLIPLVLATVSFAQTVVYEGARLITGDGAAPIENGAFVVQNGHITALGPQSAVKAPAGAVHVSLAGKTVMPGMVNAHVHIGYEGYSTWQAENYTPANVLDHLQREAFYGTAATQSVGTSPLEQALQFQKDQAAGKFAPASHFLFLPGYAPPGGGPDEVLRVATNKLHVINEVSTDKEARASIQKMAGLGIKAVKVWVDDRRGTYPKITPEALNAIIDESHKHGMLVHAHATTLKDQKAVVKAGADVVVHLVQGEKLDDEYLALLKEKKPYWATVISLGDPTAVCEKDPFFEQAMPAAVVAKIRATMERKPLAPSCGPPSPNAATREEVLKYNFPRMISSGARIVLGTDTGIEPGHTFGSGEHVEMARWVNLGLTPMQAIVAATSRPAELLGLKDMGSLAVGKRASFVVLDANPLDDIHNTRKIAAVYLDGAKYDRDAMIARWKKTN